MTADESVDWAAAYRYLEVELESVLARLADRMEQVESAAAEARRGRVRSVSLIQRDSGELESIIAADGAELTYTFVVYRDDVMVREHSAGASNTLAWRPSRSGTYRVRGYARTSGEDEADMGESQAMAVTVGTE